MTDQSSHEGGDPTGEDPREALAEAKEAYLDRLNGLLQSDPERFLLLICHAVLNRDLGDRSAADLPMRPIGDESGVEEHCRQRFSYIADLLLRRNAGSTLLPDAQFVSLAQWVERDANLSEQNIWINCKFKHVRPMDIWREYFSNFEGAIGMSVALCTLLVHQGVPLYQKSQVSETYSLLERDTPLYHYLDYRGRAFDVVPALELPDWAHKLHFCKEHLKWHRVFFDSLESDDPAEVILRRTALLNHLGLPDVAGDNQRPSSCRWPWGDRETVLLQHLAEAAAKWWTNFDPGDNTTAPTNEQVSAWLQSRGVAKSMSDKMATILRADGLPSGPRT